MEAVLRLAFSVLLKILFETIKDLNDDNTSTAYLLAFFTSFIWFISQVSRHNAFYEVAILVGKIRSTLLTLMFKKLTKLSQYTSKAQELGKIMNMISNDFNVMEIRTAVFFAALVSPIIFVGVIIILVLRLGWTGVIPILVTILLVPLQFYVGKVNGAILR